MASKDAVFQFVARDTSGWSPGFDVTDADLLPSTMDAHGCGGRSTAGGTVPSAAAAAEGRRRLVVVRESVHRYPAVPRLVVANLLLNNWDWKTSNNKIYELSAPVAVCGGGSWCAIWARRWAHDVSADSQVVSPAGFRTRDTERRAWIRSAGIHPQYRRSESASPIRLPRGSIVTSSTVSRPPTSGWTCQAPEPSVRASNGARYSAPRRYKDHQQATRYVGKIKSKIAQGLALTAPPAP